MKHLRIVSAATAPKPYIQPLLPLDRQGFAYNREGAFRPLQKSAEDARKAVTKELRLMRGEMAKTSHNTTRKHMEKVLTHVEIWQEYHERGTLPDAVEAGTLSFLQHLDRMAAQVEAYEAQAEKVRKLDEACEAEHDLLREQHDKLVNCLEAMELENRALKAEIATLKGTPLETN